MELFTTIEAAQQIGIGDAYLRNLISDGKAHPTKMIGGTWMFDAAEIERLRNRPISKGGRPKKKVETEP